MDHELAGFFFLQIKVTSQEWALFLNKNRTRHVKCEQGTEETKPKRPRHIFKYKKKKGKKERKKERKVEQKVTLGTRPEPVRRGVRLFTSVDPASLVGPFFSVLFFLWALFLLSLSLSLSLSVSLSFVDPFTVR